MKRSFVIVLLVLISLLAAETTEVNEQMNGPRRPLYEKVPIIRDYRINQPIKGAIRLGPVAFGFGYVGATLYLNEGKKHTDWNLKEASGIGWEVSKISMIAAALHGLYTGSKAQNKKKNDPAFFLEQNKLGYEFSVMAVPFSLSKAITGKYNMSFTLTYDHKYRFIDEMQFSFVTVKWPELENSNHKYEEIKFDLRGNNFFREGHIFSPYYGLGGGLSYGKRRRGEWYYDNEEIESNGVYPFIHSSTGVRFSILGFFYLKMETDIELSSFYFKASSYEHYSFLTNLTLGLVIGTKIF